MMLLWSALMAGAAPLPSSSPSAEGLDPAGLAAALDSLRAAAGRDGVDQVVVLRHGRLIWAGPAADAVHGIWSATKVFSSSVLGLLIADGRCTLETRAAEVLPDLATHYPDVTLRQFATMTSGYRAVGDEPKGSYRHGPSSTPFQPSPEPCFAPGTQYAYWDSAMNQFGRALTKLAGEPLEQFFARRIARPIGLADEAWAWGFAPGEPGLHSGSGNQGGSVQISARELARLGQLFLQRGRWGDQQLLPESWVTEATRNQVPVALPLYPDSGADGRGVYGYNWWVNGVCADGRRKWPGAPVGTFSASGFNNNDLFVIPEWDTVVVRLGLDQADAEITDEAYGRFLEKLGAARRDG